MTQSPDERSLELRELFYETSQELLQALNDEALKLEKQPGDEEIVRGIRRTVHTLKGDSAACGLRELSELAHQFEDALSLEGTAAHSAVADIAFAAADVFVEMIAAFRPCGKRQSSRRRRRRPRTRYQRPRSARRCPQATAHLRTGAPVRSIRASRKLPSRPSGYGRFAGCRARSPHRRAASRA